MAFLGFGRRPLAPYTPADPAMDPFVVDPMAPPPGADERIQLAAPPAVNLSRPDAGGHPPVTLAGGPAPGAPRALPIAKPPTPEVVADPTSPRAGFMDDYLPSKTPVQRNAPDLQTMDQALHPAQPWKPSTWSLVNAFLGGENTDAATRRMTMQHYGDDAALEDLRRMQTLKSNLTPAQWLALKSNPTEFGKALSSGMESVTLSKDQSRYNPLDGTDHMAPQVVTDGGFSVKVDPNNRTTSMIGAVPYTPKMNNLKEGETAKPDPVFFGGRLISAPDQPQTLGGGPVATPAPTGETYDRLGALATQLGASPGEVGYAKRLAQVESSGSPTASNGSSTGIFQFHPATFAANGGDPSKLGDVGEQTRVMLAMQRKDRQALQAAGLNPDDANAYILHQQGPGGGMGLLRAPSGVGAIDAVAPSYGGDRKIATQAIAANIGMPYKTPQQQAAANAVAQSMSAQDFVGMWRQRWSGGASGGDQSAPTPSGPPGTLYGDPKPPSADDVPMTQQAVDMAASRFAMTGALPTLGQGKAAHADKVAIQNRAAELIQQWGIKPEDWVTGMAQFKIAQGTLGVVQRTRTLVTASESAVDKNMAFVEGLANQVRPGQVPFLNRYIMALRTNFAGDPDAKAYDNALHTVADEYAKVLTTSTGSGGQNTSDSARTEAYRRLSSAMNIPQLHETFKAIRVEMANKRAGLEDQEKALADRMRYGVMPPPGGGAPGADPANPQAPPQAAPARPAGTNAGWNDVQWQAASRFRGSKATVGSYDERTGQGNPFVLTDPDKQYAKLKPGSWYIGPDGQVRQK